MPFRDDACREYTSIAIARRDRRDRLSRDRHAIACSIYSNFPVREGPNQVKTSIFEKTLSALLTFSACVIAIVMARQEFFADKLSAAARSVSASPVFRSEWRTWLPSGHTIGRTAAPLQIVVFSDFECPFCAKFANRWKGLQRRYGDSISMTFLHYPLSIHRFAVPAARAAECAADQGRFQEFHDLLFLKQDSLGLKSWGSYAEDASIPQPQDFLNCTLAQASNDRVERGKAIGKAIQVKGTPTVVINGWIYPRTPDDSTIERLFRTAARGNSRKE